MNNQMKMGNKDKILFIFNNINDLYVEKIEDFIYKAIQTRKKLKLYILIYIDNHF